MNVKTIKGVIILFLMLLACPESRSQMNLNLLNTEMVSGTDLVAKLPNGDLCVTGTRIDNGVEKAFISRRNAAGALWTKELGIGSSPRINDLIIDAAGNAGFCGSSVLSGPDRSAFVSRFDMSSQTFILHQTWQSGPTSASNLIATASGKEYIVTGSWQNTTAPYPATTPSIFVASVDISGNGTGISWFKDVYERFRTSGVGLTGSFHPTALCEMKDGYAISFYRQISNSKDAWTFLILKNGIFPINSFGNTIFAQVDINFNRISASGSGQGIISNAIGDLTSNTATLFYTTSSTSGASGMMNAEEGIAAVLVTYNTTGNAATIGDQTFLRLPGSPTVDILRMRSLVYDNNEAYLAGSIGTTNHDAFLVHLNRTTFMFTNAYKLIYTSSQEEVLHICGTVGSLSCSYTSDGYGTTEKMLLGSLSLASLGGICQFSNYTFDDFDHNNPVAGTSIWFAQNKTPGTTATTVLPLTIGSTLRCEPCPEPSRSTVNLTYCNTGNVTGTWYQPFASLGAGEKYVLTGIGNSYSYDSEIGYDDHGTHISGLISHFLAAGSYKFDLYSADGCLISEITVNVTEITPSLTISMTTNLSYCATPGTHSMWVNPCDMLIKPANFMYTLEDLGSTPAFPMYNSDDWAAAHGGNGCISHFLTDGSYKVKMYDKSGCSYIEVTINITHTTPTLMTTIVLVTNLSYCAIPGVNGMWVSPCDYFTLPSDFMYTLEDLGSTPAFPTYNSDDWATAHGGNGCISHFLTDGSYKVKMFDKASCTYIERTINVTHTTPTLNPISFTNNLSYCALPGVNGMWVSPCDYFITSSAFMYTLEDLASTPAFPMYNSDNWAATHGGNGCISHFLGDGSYKVKVYDKTACTYTEYNFNITHTTPSLVFSTMQSVTYCAMPGEPGTWVNPCNFFVGFDPNTLFTFQDMAIPHVLDYNSETGYDNGGTHVSGCIPFYLTAGTYQFNYYDKASCTYNSMLIIVTATQPTVNVCTKYITLRCGDPEPDLGAALADLDCPDCNYGAGTEPTTWSVSQYGDLPLNLAKVYTRQYLNKANCSICEVKIIVQYVYQEIITQSIHVTAHCPLTQSFNIRPMFLPQFVVTGPIYHYASPGALEPELVSGDYYAFCCPQPAGIVHVFEAVGPEGCLYRMRVDIECDPLLELAIPNSKIAGSSQDHQGDQSSQKAGAGAVVKGDIKVSPNPSTGIYTILYHCDDATCTTAQTYEIYVTDLSGKVVFIRSDLKVNTSESFDLSQFASGVYTVKVTCGDTVQFVKLIKS